MAYNIMSEKYSGMRTLNCFSSTEYTDQEEYDNSIDLPPAKKTVALEEIEINEEDKEKLERLKTLLKKLSEFIGKTEYRIWKVKAAPEKKLLKKSNGIPYSFILAASRQEAELISKNSMIDILKEKNSGAECTVYSEAVETRQEDLLELFNSNQEAFISIIEQMYQSHKSDIEHADIVPISIDDLPEPPCSSVSIEVEDGMLKSVSFIPQTFKEQIEFSKCKTFKVGFDIPGKLKLPMTEVTALTDDMAFSMFFRAVLDKKKFLLDVYTAVSKYIVVTPDTGKISTFSAQIND